MGFRNQISLLKHFNSVKIAFNPFDDGAGAARMMMTPFSSDKVTKVNDKLKLDLDIGTHIVTPTISIAYKDGKKVEINASKMALDDLERSVFKHANTIQNKEDGM